MAGLQRSELRSLAKQRADMENSSFIDDDEWNLYLDEAGSELHDLIIRSDPLSFRTLDTVSLVSGTEAYALPSDYYKTQAVFLLSGGERYPLQRFMLHELGNGEEVYFPATSGNPRKYDVIGSNIYFYPLPNSSSSVEHWYIPQYVRKTQDTDTYNYPVVNGWEQYITLVAAIKGMMKEESDVSQMLMEKGELKQRITSMAANKDHFSPKRLRDAYGTTSRFRRYRQPFP